MTNDPHPSREFHVSRRARDRYRFDETLFSLTGNVIFADFRAARDFAHRMNEQRDVANRPDRAVSAGQLNAMGLVDELTHLMVARYRERTNPQLLEKALAHLEEELGPQSVDEVLRAFVSEFPPLAVYRGELGPEEWLAGRTGADSHREAALEELMLLWLANRNSAFAPFRELFDDSDLKVRTAYLDGMESLRRFLAGQPGVEGTRGGLLELLEAPMRAAPDSLEAQLEFIRGAWSVVLGRDLDRVLSSLDLLAEEHRPFFGHGPGPAAAPSLDIVEEDEREAYSEDRDWMPRLVLMAKNAFVWLEQLSHRYGRTIDTLDGIPDEELDRLQSWGITGLWLIGIWERSRASARIKQRMGDGEAVASAYSLQDYRIADDLGGDGGFDELKGRAWERGIRMATDMVPNHVGIDSRWVTQHPDWFVSLDHSPFPNYSFNGPDLSDDERVGVFIEDHYWDRSDAAVVFKRVDRWTGAESFIYHGNDGTSMPWNDTAQLNFCRADVREAVIQTILHVARQSPVIRFDAAMTLVKKHFHRLWFPAPGTGGDIPSRAGHGMTRAEFDAAMPEEFWREVVDRVAREAPDTLLLAEAFWLLEGYFVRSLGMHRVYNSAFMNMFRDEMNAEYRHLISSTLEFDPRILKRYVNFMSNPDERTAIDQFGRDDKYFGVATMMATLPGLPMFGHGQIEGLAEKYGMEFRRPRWDESVDHDLVRRHERQLFGLVRRRAAFAEVDRFQLYDLQGDNGAVDENVIAYSNGSGDDRSLVLFHNRFAETSGWIRISAPVQTIPGGDESSLRRTSLADALELPNDENAYVVLPDVATGLEFLRSCAELHRSGLFVQLQAYSLHVFLTPRVVRDDETGRYGRLLDALQGQGVASVDRAADELDLADVLEPFDRLVDAEFLAALLESDPADTDVDRRSEALAELMERIDVFLEAMVDHGEAPPPDATRQAIADDLEQVLAPEADAGPLAGMSQSRARRAAAIGFGLLRRLVGPVRSEEAAESSKNILDDWFLADHLRHSWRRMGLGADETERAASALRAMVRCRGWWRHLADDDDPATLAKRLLADPDVAEILGVNRYEGVDWFVAEGWDELLHAMAVAFAVEKTTGREAAAAEESLARLAAASKKSGYRVDRLLEILDGGPTS